ncbi:Gp138 family membrane-puncturing spike protein [Acinetobacter junii]|uniref:Gp138 family membrane-puncturing spike protein n=1 Tax=Acinetobacter junii TaxID=40215 RepID=UPI00124EEE20|nr:Gp138 family membrane-puncturing spike protein [Acinetobacter junii]
MALSFNELAPDQLSIVRDAIRAELANLWTALPCEIDSYDSEAVTVNVQPLIKIPVMTKTGEIETVELPVIEDVPVMFPCAGGFTITHPINKGDECLVSFADRNIDLWWQSGGIQNPFDMRKHDLSDGFAFFRPQSQTKKIGNISTENLEIRNDENTCKIQITPGGEIHFIGSKAIFHCDVEMNKTLTVKGIIKSLADVIAKTISLFGHKHGGVKSGGDDSGGPK